MSTTQVAATLFQLQQLDLELDRLKAEDQALTTSLQGNASLRRFRQELDAARQQWQASLQAQKDSEWTLEDINQRLEQQEKRLYNGNTTNPKELQSLQQETQRLRAQQSRQEERVLEALDLAESLQENVDRKEIALKGEEERWQKEQAALFLRREQIAQQQQTLSARRSQITSGLDEALVKRYEAMRKSKQGRAVSKVENNSCQWCRVILTPSELQLTRISNELQTCTNCGRILYYDRP